MFFISFAQDEWGEGTQWCFSIYFLLKSDAVQNRGTQRDDSNSFPSLFSLSATSREDQPAACTFPVNNWQSCAALASHSRSACVPVAQRKEKGLFEGLSRKGDEPVHLVKQQRKCQSFCPKRKQAKRVTKFFLSWPQFIPLFFTAPEERNQLFNLSYSSLYI